MMLGLSIGKILFLLAFLNNSLQDVRVGVDLVTKLSNNLLQSAFKEVLAKSENAIFSPFGFFSNLAMILEASNGKTREEILQVLRVSSNDLTHIRDGFKAYCDLFSKYSSEAEAAGSFNAASISSSFKLNKSYKDVLETYFCANVSESLPENGKVLEFSSIAGVMSHWKDYEKLAVYTFLSHKPLIPFKKRNNFTALVPMIPQVGIFRTKRWHNSQVILLPLQAKLVDLLLIIPGKTDDMKSLVKELTEMSISLLVQSLPKQEMELFIPQMAIVIKNFDVAPMLIQNGVREIFDGKKSNLSKAIEDPELEITLKKVEQNAYFSTSFVALNSVSGMAASLEVSKRSKRDTKKFYVDQPFLFFILQKDTQLILLAGKVESPGQIPS